MRVRGGILRGELVTDLSHLSVRRLEAHARLHSCEGIKSGMVAARLKLRLVNRQSERLPELGLQTRIADVVGQHANDGGELAVELDLLANDGVATAERPMPEALPNQHGAWSA